MDTLDQFLYVDGGLSDNNSQQAVAISTDARKRERSSDRKGSGNFANRSSDRKGGDNFMTTWSDFKNEACARQVLSSSSTSTRRNTQRSSKQSECSRAETAISFKDVELEATGSPGLKNPSSDSDSGSSN